MEDGSFVRVDLIGKIKESGEIFETTKEEVAREAGIFNEKLKYQPLLVIVGSKNILPALENFIKTMKVGEKRTVELEPKDAFGERKSELIRTFSLSFFKEQKVEPFPGANVTINGLPGRVISVSGGRVRVDFNHPLAGKTVIYEIEIKEEIKGLEEKISAIVDYYSGLEKNDFSLKIEDKTVEIDTKDKDLLTGIKRDIAETIKKWVGMEKVKFISNF